ncbi:MAG TPA: rod shape-determining protein MreD [Mycobacteriales bacterium]|nr:rod shape-determining protein MreD [Mycobacteriales bacterium]
MSRRILLAVACVLTALLLQATVVDRLRLPGGEPDLLLVTLASLALVGGPVYGAVAGFAAGLLADVLPPADHTIGRLAFVYAVVGYFAGLLEDAEERSVFAAVAVVALGSVGAVVLYGGVGALLGDARVTAHAVEHALVATVLYDVFLAPFIVPLVSGAARRVEPATTY